MARYRGKIGFAGDPIESKPSTFTEPITEHTYSGDILRDRRRFPTGPNVHEDVVAANRLSIVADAFATNHAHNIRYAIMEGVRWRITDFEVKRPRLILTLGGVYNGPTP